MLHVCVLYFTSLSFLFFTMTVKPITSNAAFQPGMFPGGKLPPPGNRQLPPEIFCRPQFLERVIPYTLLLEYKKQPFVPEYPDMRFLGAKLAKKLFILLRLDQ